MLKRMLQSIGIILVSAILGQTATAVQLRPTPHPVILSTAVDTEKDLLVISGQNFGNAPPTVRSANQVLEVKSSSPNRIVVSLPSGIEAATYLLTVTTHDGLNTSGWFTTAVVAVNE
jgi:hypothetical protein